MIAHLNFWASNFVSLVKVVFSARCASAWLNCQAFSLVIACGWNSKYAEKICQVYIGDFQNHHWISFSPPVVVTGMRLLKRAAFPFIKATDSFWNSLAIPVYFGLWIWSSYYEHNCIATLWQRAWAGTVAQLQGNYRCASAWLSCQAFSLDIWPFSIWSWT